MATASVTTLNLVALTFDVADVGFAVGRKLEVWQAVGIISEDPTEVCCSRHLSTTQNQTRNVFQRTERVTESDKLGQVDFSMLIFVHFW